MAGRGYTSFCEEAGLGTYRQMRSPVGKLTLVAKNDHLVAILWENDVPDRVRIPRLESSDAHSILFETERQLLEYFLGKRRSFQLPIELTGTEFQKRVWKALENIPYGQTCSYSELAAEIGSPEACRAVGAANGRNPISIVLPCHRVVGKSGDLTGFAGGIENKRRLLHLEDQVLSGRGKRMSLSWRRS